MTPDTRLTTTFLVYAAVLLYLSVGAATLPQLDWYQTLALPMYALPPVVVSAAWLVVFLSGAFSLATFWQQQSSQRSKSFVAILGGYGVIAALLVLWNFLFFGLGLLAPASLIALSITSLVALLMIVLRRACSRAALILVPFLVWMLYASWFNYTLSMLNPL